MIKLALLLIAVSVALLLVVPTVAVFSQEEPPTEVPPPYAGLENPFSWSDASAQEWGKGTYQRSCLGCHGVDGGSIAESDFSAADYPQMLEESPDFLFWILSEGRLDRGMPPYKSSLSEEQRWQVLTYLWSLGAAAPPEPTPTETPTGKGNATLLLTAPEQAQSGEPLTLTAVVKDSQGKPIRNAAVRFFIEVDFFASGLMEIGEAVANDQGVAVLEYTPRLEGDIEILARYDGDGFNPAESTVTLTLAGSDEPFYEVEVGMQLPTLGDEVFIGPQSALAPGEMGKAPTSAFRLPGGILSWLLLFVVVVMIVWLTYFLVMYQVFRIPIVRETGEEETRLVPLVGMAIVVVMGIVLGLMILTGPYSHFHLPR